jgi:hypothetical protein
MVEGTKRIAERDFATGFMVFGLLAALGLGAVSMIGGMSSGSKTEEE